MGAVIGPPSGWVRAGGAWALALSLLLGLADAGWASTLSGRTTGARTVSLYVTNGDLSERVAAQPPLALTSGAPPASEPAIQVDEATRGQSFQGIGAAMTDSSAWLLGHLPPAAERFWLGALFRPTALHLAVLRVPIGASDFTAAGRPYSYDDLPAGHSDRRLRFFSIVHDYVNVIPALRQVRALAPAVRVMASLWSPPGWMKVNRKLSNPGGAGKLRGDMYGPLARYFVRFLKAYARAGVAVRSITPQNEPGQPTPYPGMALSEGAEASFIASYLAPALRAARLSTRIYGYDWNWSASLPPFAAALPTGPAGPYLSGLAWHCYYGDPTVMSVAHQLNPGLDQVVSECAQGGENPFSTSELLIASLRNWASSVSLWNLALTPAGGPVQPPNAGCAGCKGILTIDPRSATVTPTRDFYELAQVSHFVSPGAPRLASTSLVSPQYLRLVTPGVDDVVFENPDGQKVMVAYNSSDTTQEFAVRDGASYFSYELTPATTATFIW